MLRFFLTLFSLFAVLHPIEMQGFQENPQVQLRSARKLIQEQQYDQALELLRQVRTSNKNATENGHTVWIYIQTVELQGKVHLNKKEYDQLADFLKASTDDFCDRFTKNEMTYVGTVYGLLQQLEHVKKYAQALQVYQFLYKIPGRFAVQKPYLRQKIDALEQKMTQKEGASIQALSRASKERNVGGILSLLNAYQDQMDEIDSEDGEDASLREGLQLLSSLPSMFGLDEDSTLEDMKKMTFDDMNLDFEAMRRMTELSGELDEDSGMMVDSIQYLWNVAKNNDSLLFTKQRKSSEKNLAALKKNGGASTSLLIENYNLYSSSILLGEYDEAEKYLKEFERIYNILPPEDQGGFAIETVDLSFWTIYMNKEEYPKALEYAFKRLEANKEPKRESDMMMSIIITYFLMRDFTNAEKWSEKAISSIQASGLKNRESTLNQARMFYSQSLLATGKYEAALKGFESVKPEKVKQNRPATTRSSWELYFSPVAGKAIAHLRLGNTLKADAYMAEYIRMANSEIFQSVLGIDTGITLAENSENSVANTIFYYISQRPSASGPLTALAYNSALIFKELLLNKDRTIADNYLKTEDAELQTLFLKYIAVKERSKDLHVDRATRDSLADYDRAYEKILKKKGKNGLVNLFDTGKLRFSDVRNQLDTDAVAVEFVTYSPFGFMENTSETRYGAFVFTKNSSYPEFIPLCTEKQLRPLVNLKGFRGSTAALTKRIYSTHGEAIHDLVWKPIAPKLRNAQKVYYAPTGLLHTLSFEALPNRTGGFLAESKALVRLGSTKNVGRRGPAKRYEEVALFGAIDYDKTNTEVLRGDGERSKEFVFLLGTQQEINQIAQQLKNAGIRTSLTTQAEATEEAFYQVAGENPEILHIATHGFFVTSSQEDRFAISEHMGYALIKENTDAMNRSGLAFAGANVFWKSGQKEHVGLEDGILTANELGALDLGQTELVVLSACESGIGEALNNEGVFGLQRGLKMAGAKSLLLSLWKVDDRVTQEYMVSFYDFLVSQNLSVVQAYAKTQEKMRKKYPDPYYWAPFVLIQ